MDVMALLVLVTLAFTGLVTPTEALGWLQQSRRDYRLGHVHS